MAVAVTAAPGNGDEDSGNGRQERAGKGNLMLSCGEADGDANLQPTSTHRSYRATPSSPVTVSGVGDELDALW
jgi:hypothetical protein